MRGPQYYHQENDFGYASGPPPQRYGHGPMVVSSYSNEFHKPQMAQGRHTPSARAQGVKWFLILAAVIAGLGVAAGAAAFLDSVIGEQGSSVGSTGANISTSSPTPTTIVITRSPTPLQTSPTTSPISPTPSPISPTPSPTRPTPFPTNPTPFPTLLTSRPTIAPTPAPVSPYVNVIFTSPSTTPTVSQRAFTRAATRWSTILRGTRLVQGRVDTGSTFNDFSCNLDTDVELPTTISALFIAAEISRIDGIGRVLGSAGPCAGALARVDDSSVALPVIGQMKFDSEDLDSLVRDGTLEDVILHEMGHVLGIGTLWGRNGIIRDPIFGSTIQPGNNPRYVGASGKAEFAKLSGTTDDIPVEDGSFQRLTPEQILARAGLGSIDGHWRETVFVNELMTPAINSGVSNPLSAMSIRSLEDLGYVVDVTQANSYSIPSRSLSKGATFRPTTSRYLHSDIFISPGLGQPFEVAMENARKRRVLTAQSKANTDGPE